MENCALRFVFHKFQQIIIVLQTQNVLKTTNFYTVNNYFIEILHGLVGQVYRDVKVHVKKIAQSLGLYLANKETETILFKPIKVMCSGSLARRFVVLLNYLHLSIDKIQ